MNNFVADLQLRFSGIVSVEFCYFWSAFVVPLHWSPCFSSENSDSRRRVAQKSKPLSGIIIKPY